MSYSLLANLTVHIICHVLLLSHAGQWASHQEEDPPTNQMATPRNDPSQPPAGMTTVVPGGGGGDDDEDDDYYDEEEEYGEEEGSGEDSEEEGEREMVVLDPDHPLMKRFQTALKRHLDQQNEKVTLELRELLEGCKKKSEEREDAGVELYGIQQELARHQMMLEKEHDNFSKSAQARSQVEQQLNDVRVMYRENQTKVNEEKKKGVNTVVTWEFSQETNHVWFCVFRGGVTTGSREFGVTSVLYGYS